MCLMDWDHMTKKEQDDATAAENVRFLAECERRAGQPREEMLKHIEDDCEAQSRGSYRSSRHKWFRDWLRRILGDAP